MANFGWDLPPGVTGRELEIAGPDWEGELEVECDAENVTVRALSRTSESGFVEVDLNDCVYVGAVDAWSYGGVTHWTCPLCGTEHDIDERV